MVSTVLSCRVVSRHSRLKEIDEPEEIIHVRQGLEQHLTIDPSVTMTVLCDQLSWSEDEQGNREQLRTLVLEFLVKNIRSLNVAILRSSDRILVEGIINVSFPLHVPTPTFMYWNDRPFQVPRLRMCTRWSRIFC